MQIKLAYKYIGDIANLLINMPLKGKQARHRTRFVNLLIDKNKQIGEEELALIKEFAGVDEDGEPKRKENGNFDIADVPGFQKQQEEFLEEEYILEGGDHHGMLKTVKKIVLEYDGEVSGREGFVYDHLCEAFENSGDEKESAE